MESVRDGRINGTTGPTIRAARRAADPRRFERRRTRHPAAAPAHAGAGQNKEGDNGNDRRIGLGLVGWQTLSMAARRGDDHAADPLGPARTVDGPSRVLVVRPAVRVRRDPGPRYADRRRSRQSARSRRPAPRTRALLPLYRLSRDAGRIHRVLHVRVDRRHACPRVVRLRRLRAVARRRDGHLDQHRARTRAQDQPLRALARESHARAGRVRTFLRRAQSRPSRARRDGGGSGERALRRIVLGVPAAHRGRQHPLGLAARDGAPRAPRAFAVDLAQRGAACVGDDRRRVGHRDRDSRQGRDSVPRDPGRVRCVAARSRQLRRTLRARPPQAAERPLRTLHAAAFVEQQSRRHQPVPVSVAAARRPSREPDTLIPGAAPLRRLAATAGRLRDDDPVRVCAAALVSRDESACRRALRRRHGAVQHQAVDPRARARAVFGRGVMLDGVVAVCDIVTRPAAA
ncbi:hypothetical protein BDI4_290123 [Burkholderia diffusa]|nr:hypothetical protein BDI4_290123 [Burkholderia diffusa]